VIEARFEGAAGIGLNPDREQQKPQPRING
jgi:hypothetical protein